MVERTSTRVVFTIADAERVSPSELEPLAETVDPEAIDALFDEGDAVRELTFDYSGYSVTIDGDGQVVLAATPD